MHFSYYWFLLLITLTALSLQRDPGILSRWTCNPRLKFESKIKVKELGIHLWLRKILLLNIIIKESFLLYILWHDTARHHPSMKRCLLVAIRHATKTLAECGQALFWDRVSPALVQLLCQGLLWTRKDPRAAKLPSLAKARHGAAEAHACPATDRFFDHKGTPAWGTAPGGSSVPQHWGLPSSSRGSASLPHSGEHRPRHTGRPQNVLPHVPRCGLQQAGRNEALETQASKSQTLRVRPSHRAVFMPLATWV